MRQPFSMRTRAALALAACMALGVSRAPAADAPDPERTRLIAAADLVANSAITQIAQRRTGLSTGDDDDLEKVGGCYRNLINKYPNAADVRDAYASFLWTIERRKEAAVQWEAAEKLDPENSEVLNRLGGCHLAFGDTKKSTLYFTSACQLNPQIALYHYNAGNNFTVFRRDLVGVIAPDAEAVLKAGLEHFRLAAELEFFNVGYAKAYADTFYILADPDWRAAGRAWEHYLKITPDKDFAYSNLARVSLRAGEHKQAREYLDHVVRPDFSKVKESLLRQIDRAGS